MTSKEKFRSPGEAHTHPHPHPRLLRAPRTDVGMPRCRVRLRGPSALWTLNPVSTEVPTEWSTYTKQPETPGFPGITPSHSSRHRSTQPISSRVTPRVCGETAAGPGGQAGPWFRVSEPGGMNRSSAFFVVVALWLLILAPIWSDSLTGFQVI